MKIGEKDLILIKDYLILPLILTILERDMKLIERSEIKMKVVYLDFFRSKLELVTKDLSATRKAMRNHGIKVYEQERTETGINSKFLCRGYHDSFRMLWDFIKAEVKTKIRKYLDLPYK